VKQSAGWYEGFHLLLAVNPVGVMTGFGLGPASTNDPLLADIFLPRAVSHIVGRGV